MMGPRLKTPALFLLLLLLGALTGTGERPNCFSKTRKRSDTMTCLQKAFCDDGATTENINRTTNEGATTTTTVSDTSNPGNPNSTDETYLFTAEGSGSGEQYPSSDTSLENSTDILPVINSPDQDDFLLTLIGPVVAGVIFGAIVVVGVVIWRRRSKKAGNQELTKEDPHLDGPSSEKVPMPMFEEDVPSVLELEMDELDQWMKKDS